MEECLLATFKGIAIMDFIFGFTENNCVFDHAITHVSTLNHAVVQTQSILYLQSIFNTLAIQATRQRKALSIGAILFEKKCFHFLIVSLCFSTG